MLLHKNVHEELTEMEMHLLSGLRIICPNCPRELLIINARIEDDGKISLITKECICNV